MSLTQTQVTQAQSQLRDIATILRQKAEALASIADVLSAPISAPVVTPPIVTTPTSSPVGGFLGRSAVDLTIWREVFTDDFVATCPEGQFLNIYKTWGAYPESYQVTDKSGHYSPSNLSVVTIDGGNVLNLALKPGTATRDGKPWSCAPYPKFPGQNDASSLGMRGEFRMRIISPVPGWHSALLTWPDSEQWPHDGELDVAEFNFDGTIGAFHHNQGGTSNNDQVEFKSSNRPTDWHVIRFEWLAGKSFKLFHDDVQIGKTITSRVPTTPMHMVFQVESSGTPMQASAMQIDWVSFSVPA